jgi:hypothetical protein
MFAGRHLSWALLGVLSVALVAGCAGERYGCISAYFTIAGCESGNLYASFSQLRWDKAGGTKAELKQDEQACSQTAHVGSVTGSDDPRTYSDPRNTPEQIEADRLYLECMKARGWWIINPTTSGA